MDFLDFYPNKKTNSKKFAKEITRMVSIYPRDYNILESNINNATNQQ